MVLALKPKTNEVRLLGKIAVTLGSDVWKLLGMEVFQTICAPVAGA